MSDKYKPTMPFMCNGILTEKGIKYQWTYFGEVPKKKKWVEGSKPHGRKVNKNNKHSKG